MAINKAASINPVSNAQLPSTTGAKPVQGDKDVFRSALRSQVEDARPDKMGPGGVLPQATAIPHVKFSNHAIERMRVRGISFSPDEVQRIDSAVQKASEKGAKETLVITENSAMVVSVKNNTVVTVMDRNSLKENVFTNIDSTVLI